MNTWKNPVWIILFILPSFYVLQLYPTCYNEQLSFDRLYPMNLFKKAVEECTYVWGQCERYSKSMEKMSNAIIMEIGGRILFATYCLEQLQKDFVASYDYDLVYLSRLIATIEMLFLSMHEQKEIEHYSYLQHAISQLHTKLNQLLQGNDSISGTSH